MGRYVRAKEPSPGTAYRGVEPPPAIPATPTPNSRCSPTTELSQAVSSAGRSVSARTRTPGAASSVASASPEVTSIPDPIT